MIVTSNGIAAIAETASAGRYTTSAARNSIKPEKAALPNKRQERLNRASRYSYALVTFSRLKNGR